MTAVRRAPEDTPPGRRWLGWWAACAVALLACSGRPRTSRPAAQPAPPPPATASAVQPLAPWLEHFPGLYARRGDEIVEAPAEDIAVAKGYARSPVRGPLLDGHRLTILTRKSHYRVGEEVRVVHVHEITIPGDQLYGTAPKRVRGEYVDGRLVTPFVVGETSEADPFAPIVYDGPTSPSPGVDYAYDVTRYRFSSTGRRSIQWRVGRFQSNVLTIDVEP